jgi:hypothetical protein
MSRWSAFRDLLRIRKVTGEAVVSTAAGLLEQLNIHASDGSLRESHKQSNADKSARTYSSSNHVYDGLANALQSLISRAKQNDSTYATKEYVEIAAHAYVVGHSTFATSTSKIAPPIVPFLQSAQKFAEYFRGATRLYKAVTASHLARFAYSNLSLHQIRSSEPLYIDIEPDYHHVLETIYYRSPGSPLPIARGQFLAKHGGGIQKYGDWSAQRFTVHCEVNLIRELVQVERKPPTVLGISKACYPLYFEFIQGINRYRSSHSTSFWKVGNSHHNIYNWAFGHDTDRSLVAGRRAVIKHVFDKIVELVQDCAYKSATESPQSQSSPDENQESGASLFIPQERVSYSSYCVLMF